MRALCVAGLEMVRSMCVTSASALRYGGVRIRGRTMSLIEDTVRNAGARGDRKTRRVKIAGSLKTISPIAVSSNGNEVSIL